MTIYPINTWHVEAPFRNKKAVITVHGLSEEVAKDVAGILRHTLAHRLQEIVIINTTKKAKYTPWNRTSTTIHLEEKPQ